MGTTTDYKSTIALPQTDFAMKANLAKREPDFIERWDKSLLYKSVIEKNQDKPPFVLHDGPPYANGHIHHGTILNKILKDIVIKFHNMTGHRSEFVPGWDTHGLPIELYVDKKLGKKKRDMSVLDVRAACRDYALEYLDIQRNEFKRLGVLADWDQPYMTLNKHYEATIARELGRFAGNGGMYKGTKPVHWCWSCRTALAEAEVEYAEHKSPSIYVAFDVIEGADAVDTQGKPLRAVIWTTTPWTLPANRAIAYGPNIRYRAYPHQDGYIIVSPDLREAVEKECGITLDEDKAVEVPSDALQKMRCAHPFLPDVKSPVLPADFVRLETGTGLVHIAPGHGPDDYVLGSRHGLPVVSPVDAVGRYTEEAGVFAGERVLDANDGILDILIERGRLLSPRELGITHDYPHCWRCKKPVIFRATPQWFVSMDTNNLRQKALDAIEGVQWLPSWGHDRINGMLSARPDWCLSRQRSWGMPIPAFYCDDCDAAIMRQDLIESIADRFEKEGSDAWFANDAKDLLPEGFVCPDCGGQHFRKESDIVDVWFESGVSYAAVCEDRPGFGVPVDLYLEGSDQHRGWFHSSLLAAVGTRGYAPYKSVLTHGFVVDGKGRKYSKSAQNYVSPDKIINQNGAEIFRLWVCATDFGGDLRFSNEILTRMVEAYRKIRNTLRFMLGNLHDFDPQQNTVALKDLMPVDRYMLARFGNLVTDVLAAYKRYDLHTVFQRVNEFTVVDLSAFYFDLLKDWLYCDAKDAPRRRSAQTALFKILQGYLSLMAPVLSFTAEEAHDFMPHDGNKPSSVHLTEMPDPEPWMALNNAGLIDRYNRLRLYRDHVLSQLEAFRAQKHHPLEAKVLVAGSFEVRDFLNSFADLSALFSVSQVELVDQQQQDDSYVPADSNPDFAIKIDLANGAKCARCWTWSPEVGQGENPELCPRCAEALA